MISSRSSSLLASAGVTSEGGKASLASSTAAPNVEAEHVSGMKPGTETNPPVATAPTD